MVFIPAKSVLHAKVRAANVSAKGNSVVSIFATPNLKAFTIVPKDLWNVWNTIQSPAKEEIALSAVPDIIKSAPDKAAIVVTNFVSLGFCETNLVTPLIKSANFFVNLVIGVITNCNASPTELAKLTKVSP